MDGYSNQNARAVVRSSGWRLRWQRRKWTPAFVFYCVGLSCREIPTFAHSASKKSKNPSTGSAPAILASSRPTLVRPTTPKSIKYLPVRIFLGNYECSAVPEILHVHNGSIVKSIICGLSTGVIVHEPNCLKVE